MKRSFAVAQDDSGALMMTESRFYGIWMLCIACYSKCYTCHVERSKTSFTLFLPTVIPSFWGTVIPTELYTWASYCHFFRYAQAASRLRLCALLSFRPSGASGEICMLCAAPSSEYTVSDDYSAGAAGSSTLKGSPRARLLPIMSPYDVTAAVIRDNGRTPGS